MDIIDVQNACKIAGIPKEVIDEIWKPIGDSGYIEMMRKARESNGIR